MTPRQRHLLRFTFTYSVIVVGTGSAQSVVLAGPNNSSGWPVDYGNITGPIKVHSLYAACIVATGEAAQTFTAKLYSGQPTGGNVTNTVSLSLATSNSDVDGEDTSSDHLWVPGDPWWVEFSWSAGTSFIGIPWQVVVTWERAT